MQETLAQWLSAQVARGCTLSSMIETMLEGGYSLPDAHGHVTQAFIAAGKLPSVNQAVAPAINVNARTISTYRETLDHKPVMRLNAPHIMVFDEFLSEEECDTLVALSEAKLLDSAVVDPKTGKHVMHEGRTSRGTYFPHQSEPVVTAIENRIEALFGYRVNQQEAIQILNYPVGGEYKAHHDYFAEGESGHKGILNQGGQRIATFVMYLNTPPSGGGTDFPNLGLTVTAKKRSAAYFENVDEHGNVVVDTLHAGMPVLTGEKWIATKWIREKPFF